MSISITSIIHLVFNLITFIIIADAVVSFILPPYNPVRSFLDKIVNPMLDPIRRIVPPMAGFDFSPIVLLLAFQLVEFLLVRLIS